MPGKEFKESKGAPAETGAGRSARYDVIIVGAGFGGMYMLHKLRGLGLSARVLDAATGAPLPDATGVMERTGSFCYNDCEPRQSGQELEP